jgi:signal transduction histidine kinase
MVYLNALIEDAICMQHGALERRRITIVKHLDKNNPRLVIDQNRLMQVVNNLIKNSYEAIDALNYEDNEKTITFKTFSDKRQAGFEIADDGIGIEEEQLNRALEIGKSSKGSSGFGLYYCKMFVEDNNGQLIFNSTGKGKGAVVRVTFDQQEMAPYS